jgi:hypothetical protein
LEGWTSFRNDVFKITEIMLPASTFQKRKYLTSEVEAPNLVTGIDY